MSIAPGSLRTYCFHFNTYVEYCTDRQLYPLSDITFQKFVYSCFKHGYSYSKVNITRSAIIFWCGFNDCKFQFSKLSVMGLKAFKRLYLHGKPNIWMPVEHLSRIIDTYNPVQDLYYCLLTISFFTLVRPVEILFLHWKHINLLDCFIWLPWSKNNPFGSGTYVTLLEPAYVAFSRLAKAYGALPPQDSIVFNISQSSLNSWLARKCAEVHILIYT